MAIFTVTTNEYENLPPSQVGDGSASTDYDVVYTFSTADFTTSTIPVYSDPEGDSASQLRVLTLPATGVLKYNNIDIIINQVINFTDIGNGLMSYTPDSGTLIQYVDTFEFEIADSGSGVFVG